MNATILFRGSIEHEDELRAARQYFPNLTLQRNILHNTLVIGRYSVLPFYRELELDLAINQCKLINSYDQHLWIANGAWIHSFHNTPKTYTDLNFHTAPEGAYVVKGTTNSRKLQWNKMMFAPSKRQAADVAGDLMADPMISEQGLLYREYVPLKKLGEGLNGLPFVNEWRGFFYKENLIAIGKYWPDVVDHPEYVLTEAMQKFAQETAKTAACFVNFFVLDIAETAQGEPILIEINDGQMSGLQDIEPGYFYQNLKAMTQHG